MQKRYSISGSEFYNAYVVKDTFAKDIVSGSDHAERDVVAKLCDSLNNRFEQSRAEIKKYMDVVLGMKLREKKFESGSCYFGLGNDWIFYEDREDMSIWVNIDVLCDIEKVLDVSFEDAVFVIKEIMLARYEGEDFFFDINEDREGNVFEEEQVA